MRDALNRVMYAVTVGRNLGETDDQRLLDMVHEGLDSGVNGYHVTKFVAAKIIQERIADDPARVVMKGREVLDSKAFKWKLNPTAS